MTIEETAADRTASLLERAAALIAEAVGRLATDVVACPTCEARLFSNYDQARVKEQLTELPEKLRRCAERVKGSVTADGGPASSSRGYLKAVQSFFAATRRS